MEKINIKNANERIKKEKKATCGLPFFFMDDRTQASYFYQSMFFFCHDLETDTETHFFKCLFIQNL